MGLPFILFFSLAVVVPATTASPESASQWFYDIIHPKKGSTIDAEISCYALPYGVLGLVSHLLTYYTTICLGFGVRPLKPWKALTWHWWDLSFCLSSMVITVTLAAFTMSSCRNSWPFLLLGLWKLALSFSVNGVGVVQALRGKPVDQRPTEANPTDVELTDVEPTGDQLADEEPAGRRQTDSQPTEEPGDGKPAKEKPRGGTVVDGKALYVAIVYYVVSFIGLVGTLRIVHETFADNKAVRILTGLFIGGTGVIVIFFIVVTIFLEAFGTLGRTLMSTLSAPFAWGTILLVAIFYSDLVLGAVDYNWVGTPSQDVDSVKYAYWIYFAAKRIPMLAW